MKVLITGAKGFVGKNLAANLYCIKDGKNRTRDLTIDEIFEYDIDTEESLLDTYCEKDIARQSGKYEQIYFLDDGQETSDLILGTCLEYMKFADGNTEMYPAFGNNEMRLNWMKKLSDAQIVLPRLIHATAYVSPTAEVEAGTVVLPLAIINTDCRIQSGCIINCGSIVDHGCVIEEGVHISPGTVIKAENRIPRATKIEAGEVVPLRAYPL